MPKVSVIIPTYNREKYIAETINSVLNQTFSDYETIVVDDGSTDNTERVIREEFADKVIYLSKSNGGPASSRNMGMRVAKGEYIAFLDSDDLWLPEKLEIQTRFMDAHPEIGLTYSWALNFRQSSNGKIEDLCLAICRDTPNLKRLLTGNCILLLTAMLRKTCLEDVGLFDEGKDLIGLEDYEYWIRIAMSYHIAYIPRVLARYRVHDENLWAGASTRQVADDALTVISRIDEKYPELISKIFGDKKSFYAEHYLFFGDSIPFLGDTRDKARFYMKSMMLKKNDLKTFIKLIVCSLILLMNVFSGGRGKTKSN